MNVSDCQIVKEIYFLNDVSRMLSSFEHWCIISKAFSRQKKKKKNVPERIGDKDNGVHHVFK